MKFKKGDIVEHILTGQRVVIVGANEAMYLPTTNTISNVYICRIGDRLDLNYFFDEIELKEIGTGKN